MSIVVEDRKELDMPLRVCKKCIELLTLLGFAASAFIVPRPIFKDITKCDVCKLHDASFIMIPAKLGITICEFCLESLTSISPKHKWLLWPRRKPKMPKCDLCGRQAKYTLITPQAILKGK
ncbi:MAG: hypothetical protein QXH55_00930 [Candidatus Korarchaeota archaeon]|nr:hypothetical protein [Thermoproteota archaeon]MCR8462701.1 hypothetical protein [Thermoproteota archaeon]MCR8470320.1 hypothetical protein [Thermoproteota archaeon]MCR8471666.1 hypothetical protein [Thermoproteota archaeon]MCR8472658.1 hypothetical protein [Thermoproteota archaeon]